MNGFFRFCYYSKVALIPPILLIPPNLFIPPILLIPLIQLSIVSNKFTITYDISLLHLGVVIHVPFATFQKQEKAKERPQKSYIVRLKAEKSERAAAEEPRRPLKNKK